MYPFTLFIAFLLISTTLAPHTIQAQMSEQLTYQFSKPLTASQLLEIKDQLENIDLTLLAEQKRLIRLQEPLFDDTFEPYENYSFNGNADNEALGKKLIEQGRLGCLILAGGQGTRLNYDKPKGTYPISVVKNKSLFQLCSEKVKAASAQAGRPLQLAIMTSLDNDVDTKTFFLENNYFGLHPSQVAFFIQDSLPMLNCEGNLFLQDPSHIASGADGNGHSLLCFARSGILERWKNLGIEYLHVILIDNPLADPFDKELLGFHVSQNVEITLKCTEKMDPAEKIGLLITQKEKCRVIEYSEMPEEKKKERRSDGRLKYCCGNLSLFCFSLSFIENMHKEKMTLPLHKAWKSARSIEGPLMAWKFETFIFDWLFFAKKTAVLIYPREQCFAPLKNASGNDSPETVREALQRTDRRVFEKVTGHPAPNFPFELEAEFYYPTQEFLQSNQI